MLSQLLLNLSQPLVVGPRSIGMMLDSFVTSASERAGLTLLPAVIPVVERYIVRAPMAFIAVRLLMVSAAPSGLFA